MSAKHCAFGNCSNDSRYSHKEHMKGVIFFRFPHRFRDKERCQKWVDACRRVDFKLENVNNYRCVCSKHFLDGRPTRMNPDPVPATLNPNILFGKRGKILVQGNNLQCFRVPAKAAEPVGNLAPAAPTNTTAMKINLNTAIYPESYIVTEPAEIQRQNFISNPIVKIEPCDDTETADVKMRHTTEIELYTKCDKQEIFVENEMRVKSERPYNTQTWDLPMEMCTESDAKWDVNEIINPDASVPFLMTEIQYASNAPVKIETFENETHEKCQRPTETDSCDLQTEMCADTHTKCEFILPDAFVPFNKNEMCVNSETLEAHDTASISAEMTEMRVKIKTSIGHDLMIPVSIPVDIKNETDSEARDMTMSVSRPVKMTEMFVEIKTLKGHDIIIPVSIPADLCFKANFKS